MDLKRMITDYSYLFIALTLTLAMILIMNAFDKYAESLKAAEASVYKDLGLD